MKLIFNPYYDVHVYVKTNGCALNEKVVGPQGLLDELELRAGLSGRYLDDFQRSIYYSKAIKHALAANESLFFAKSYEKDKLGTAAVLLRWRDALVKVGWNKSIKGSQRLDGLAYVETYFDKQGEADRWQKVLSYAQKNPILSADDCIEVRCAKDDLEPLYRRLFEHMISLGCKVEYINRIVSHDLKEKLSFYSFKNDIEMAEWLAQQQLGDNDVVVCDDTSFLNIELALEDKPQIGSNDNAIGAIMQIFALGLNLFSRPVNINTLLAYLQVPATPLAKLYIKHASLPWLLKNQLLDDNGISDKWNNLIDEAIYDYDGNKKTQNQLDELRVFINQWRRAKGEGDECEVDKSEVIKFLKAMRKWAKSKIYDNADAAQYNAIVVNCDIMMLLLEDEPDTVKTHDLNLWAAQISHPVDIVSQSARKGAINVIGAVTDIHSDPDKVYWACTTTDNRFQYDLEFLSPGETELLKNNGLEIVERETSLKTKRKLMIETLSNVKQRVFMLECDVIDGVLPAEDSVATELRLDNNLLVEKHSPNRQNTVKRPLVADSTKKSEYYIDSSTITNLVRDSESYSSLNELIQQPFDYFMDYVLKLRENGIAAMADIDTVKGNVAHAYIEKLTELGQKKVDSMRDYHKKQFNDIIDGVTEAQGAILLLEENELEYKRFKSLLKKSVEVLIDIIEQNNLTIVGAEQYYEADIETIGKMNAKIDFVLNDSDGNYVIFDFKWSEGNTYKSMLEQNNALQLAVYHAILERHLKNSKSGKKVSFKGYYVLPHHKLYTVYNTLKHNAGGIEIVVAENNADIMKMAANSYKYRMNQLKSGMIEEGEGMEIANLQYVSDMLSDNLYPLKADYYEKSIKARSYGNKNIVLKGGLN